MDMICSCKTWRQFITTNVKNCKWETSDEACDWNLYNSINLNKNASSDIQVGFINKHSIKNTRITVQYSEPRNEKHTSTQIIDTISFTYRYSYYSTSMKLAHLISVPSMHNTATVLAWTSVSALQSHHNTVKIFLKTLKSAKEKWKPYPFAKKQFKSQT